MVIKDMSHKDIFQAKLTGEPIMACINDPEDFCALIKNDLLTPVGVSNSLANYKATHDLVIQGLGVTGNAHLRKGDIFSLSIR